MIKPLVSFGNSKLPKTTMIINITSAHDCPSRRMGMCQLDKCGIGSKKCYALNTERFRSNTLVFRRRQTKWWNQTVQQCVDSFYAMLRKTRRKITAVRVGEAGDLRSAKDLEVIVRLAWLTRLLKMDLKWYLYTARKDLVTSYILDKLPPNITINGSGWMAHNEFRAVATGAEPPKPDGRKQVWCEGDCTKCQLCLKPRGIQILARQHGSGIKSQRA